MSHCFSTRLSSQAKVKPIDDRLDRFRRSRMFLRILEGNRQHERAHVLFDGHPSIGQHNAQPVLHSHCMMVIWHQLFCLFARADCSCLVWLDLIERFWHPAILPCLPCAYCPFTYLSKNSIVRCMATLKLFEILWLSPSYKYSSTGLFACTISSCSIWENSQGTSASPVP